MTKPTVKPRSHNKKSIRKSRKQVNKKKAKSNKVPKQKPTKRVAKAKSGDIEDGMCARPLD